MQSKKEGSGSKDKNEPTDDAGLKNDEYSDPSLEDTDSVDALDVRRSLRNERMLDEVVDSGDGIEEIDVLPSSSVSDTVDTGARRRPRDEAEMGLGAEAHSAEELDEAAVGNSGRGNASHEREGQMHGKGLFDSPTEAEADTDTDADSDGENQMKSQ